VLKLPTIAILCVLTLGAADALRAENDKLDLDPNDLRCQLLLQDYLGCKVRVTTAEGKKISGKLVAVDAQVVKLKIKKEIRDLPVAGIRQIEILRGTSSLVGQGIGGVFMGIGVVIGGLYLLGWLFSALN